MAEFAPALADLLAYEGGYTNNPTDAGGETYAGISRVNHPDWAGWPLVDLKRRSEANLARLNEALTATPVIQQQVADFYRTHFWLFDSISDQETANKLLGMEVLFGPSGGVRILQEALQRLGTHAIPDGVLGPATLTAAANAKGPELLHALRACCSLAHLKHILARPDQIAFADGWLWRATA